MYFLIRGDNLADVASRSDDVLIGALARIPSVFVPLSDKAGPEERAAALNEIRKQLAGIQENPQNPTAAAMKCRDSSLAAGLVEAKGRRTPGSPYETIEPVEFSALRLVGPHAVNTRREIVFNDVRLSGWALSRARQQLVASGPPLQDTSEQELPRPSPIEAGVPAKRHRGPVKDSLDRYGEADRALYPELERIVKEDHVSLTAAALKLAENKERRILLGDGAPLSRAKRLVGQYNADQKLKPAETC
jgi:hypothetical protein